MTDPTIHTRREFLHKGLTLVSAAATVPLFLDRTARAVADPFDVALVRHKPGANDDRVLVVLQLAGGNDGLNTLIPHADDLYHKARPRLAIPADKTLKIDDHLGLHPEAVGLKQLFDAGLLAIVQGVGYPNPNRSHFIATDIWSTADPAERMHDGWIGRYFDATCRGRPDPRLGIALTKEAPLALAGERFNPVSFASPDELSWRGPGAHGTGLEAFERLNTPRGRSKTDVVEPHDADSALAYLQRMALDARTSARRIQKAAGVTIRPGRGRGRGLRGPRAARAAGGPLGRQLEMVRRMIAGGLETKVYYVSLGGFDTHAGQPGRQGNLLRQLGAALADFVRALKADGLLDRVCLMTFSEFGRRVAENGSQGTDHGAAAPLFLVGERVRPGLHGPHPSLAPEDLDRGDLKWHTDFRSIYAAILTDWLKTDARKVLGSRFETLKLFK